MFDWWNYFEVAQELIQREGEAYQRSAVSRAYYAMYCNARNALDVRGEFGPPESGSEHAYVWSHFGTGPQRERRRIGELGHRLREARRKADYDDHIDNLPYVIEDAMIKAESLKAALESL